MNIWDFIKDEDNYAVCYCRLESKDRKYECTGGEFVSLEDYNKLKQFFISHMLAEDFYVCGGSKYSKEYIDAYLKDY